MRAYFFGNFYLSSIQQGIQAGHVIEELNIKYASGVVQSEAAWHLEQWGKFHKTMILLNGGDQDGLEKIYADIERLAGPMGFPFALFHESKGALNGALTSVGVILPEEIYAPPTPDPLYTLTIGGSLFPPTPKEELIQLVKSCGLAK